MKLKLGKIIYAAYIKSTRFVGYFESVELAMHWLNETYPTVDDKHVEPCWVLEEDKS